MLIFFFQTHLLQKEFHSLNGDSATTNSHWRVLPEGKRNCLLCTHSNDVAVGVGEGRPLILSGSKHSAGLSGRVQPFFFFFTARAHLRREASELAGSGSHKHDKPPGL